MSTRPFTRNNSLVPAGFLSTAHPVFFDYMPPCVEVEVYDNNRNNSLLQKKNDDSCNLTRSEDAPSNTHQQFMSSTCARNTSSRSSIPIDPEHCSICLSPHSTPITLVSCYHSFCRDCILVWFRKKAQCPLCKSTSNHFVQSNPTGQLSSSTAASSGEGDCSLSHAIKVWAICTDGDDVLPLETIHRSTVAPAIAVHTRRFLSPNVKHLRSPGVANGAALCGRKRPASTALTKNNDEEHTKTSEHCVNSNNNEIIEQAEVAGDNKSDEPNSANSINKSEDILTTTNEAHYAPKLSCEDKDMKLQAVNESLADAVRQLQELEKDLSST